MRAISSSSIEGLGEEVVGTEPKTLELGLDRGHPRQDQDRRAHLYGAQPAQDLVAVHVRQHAVENDDVVVVELGDLEPILAQIGCIHDEAFGPQHRCDAGRSQGIILDKKYPHPSS